MVSKLKEKVLKKIISEIRPDLEEVYKANPKLLFREVTDVLIGLRYIDGHIHVHTPSEKEVSLEIYRAVRSELGMVQAEAAVTDDEDEKTQGGILNPSKPSPLATAGKSTNVILDNLPQERQRKIIFSHTRAAGDALMFSAGVRDFALLFPNIRVNVDSSEGWIWENNPYIDPSVRKGDDGVEYYQVGYPAVGNCNNTYLHFSQMFLMDMIAIADLHERLPIGVGEFCLAFANGSVGDPPLGDLDKHKEIAREPFIALRSKYRKFCEQFARQRGDLHLSPEEKQRNVVKDLFGVEKYWVIAPGGKRDCTTKIWDWRRFQKVVDHFEGRIKFVVIGRSDHLIEPLRGTISLVDKTENLRDVVPLVYHADGCVSGPSFLMHLAAAIPTKYGKARKPCVVLMGGREPQGWIDYTNHQNLHTCGVFSCCDNGGCWTSRTIPLPKDPQHNSNLCRNVVVSGGRSIQACMNAISADDVIRAIELYYQGDIYSYEVTAPAVTSIENIHKDELASPVLSDAVADITPPGKRINLLGNLNTAGGGEQSLLTIADLFWKSGWDVRLFPWGSVHENYRNNGRPIMDRSFKDSPEVMARAMHQGAPLLFYGNDCTWDFPKEAQPVVAACSRMILGINYMIGDFKDPRVSRWLMDSGKLAAVIFQNQEKMEEWRSQVIGFNNARLISLFGAIDIDKFYEVCPAKREKEFVVLKHCVADYRKYVTMESVGKGKKIHLWQKNLDKDLDTKFYNRLLKDTKDIRFEFMEAHKELVNTFKGERRMVFHTWDAMPVTEFLARGHVYLYRTSNLWRDQYPRGVAEALAVGLPVLTEPRDGTKDRVAVGDTGFYCVDYDGFLYALRLLQRKEKYRVAMSQNCKDWARKNLDPMKWVDVVEEVCGGNRASAGDRCK